MVRSFSMPCLGKYVFYTNGQVKSKATGKFKSLTRGLNRKNYYYYRLFQDGDEKEVSVTPKEIIQYGKHYYEALGNVLGLNTQIVIMRPRIVTTRKSILK